jgi:hypothetical protein
MESKKYKSKPKKYGFTRDGVRWDWDTVYTTVFYTTTNGDVWVQISKTVSKDELRIELSEFIEKFDLIKK